MRRTVRVIVVVLVVCLAAGAGWFAGRHALQPAAVPTPVERSQVTVKVGQAELGRSINLNVVASQERVPVATNLLSGVVTSIAKPGSFKVGDVLYTVAGVPVRVVVGSTPFYRDLAAGDSGEDVRQLTEALVTLDLLSSAGDRYTDAVTEAVKAWQKKLKAPITGTVKLGELVAVPKLPASLGFDTKLLRTGAVLNGSEQVVTSASGDPRFDLIVSQEQAKLIPQSATVVVTHEKLTWPGVITGQENDQQGQTVLQLEAKSGGVLCGKDCGSLTIGDELTLPAAIELVPKVSGPSVPIAAISTDANGQASVQLVGADGRATTTPVTVKASQDGVAVVEGVTEGQSVKMFATADDSQPSAEPSK